jgi:hypothetical protein
VVRRSQASGRLEAPDLGEFRSTIEQLNAETSAVEAAVQEVMTLQAGGSL